MTWLPIILAVLLVAVIAGTREILRERDQWETDHAQLYEDFMRVVAERDAVIANTAHVAHQATRILHAGNLAATQRDAAMTALQHALNGDYELVAAILQEHTTGEEGG